jgi:hypothetical protein
MAEHSSHAVLKHTLPRKRGHARGRVMGNDNVAASSDPNQPHVNLEPPQTRPPRPWGMDEVVVAAFAFLGVTVGFVAGL